MSFSEIVETVLLAGTSIVALKMGFDAAGGIRILRSPKVLLSFTVSLAAMGVAVLCAYGVDRVREGTWSGISSSTLLQGMAVGLLVGIGGLGVTLLPGMKRQRRIEAFRESLGEVVGSSSPALLLGPPSALNELKLRLLEYRELVAGVPSPDEYERRELAGIEARIDQIDQSLRAPQEPELPHD